MELQELEYKKMPLAELRPMERNPRKMDDHDREELEKSITKYSMVEPIVWNEQTGNVVGGHQRLEVLAKLGVQEVGVMVM